MPFFGSPRGMWYQPLPQIPRLVRLSVADSPPCSCKSCNCNCNHSSAEKVTQTPVITTDKEEIERRNKDQDDEKALTQEDIKTVMRNIGINLDQENSMAIGNDSIPRIFDEDEPSLQEVWQAFLVFDHNNDGYFDALDLQRVLKSLGLGEGVGMDELALATATTVATVPNFAGPFSPNEFTASL
ncbi:unnamed protein product [Miscanthus lutarioriparius]|uniref:EF-hand domain-containing protein n=1 Tax=Miscanthus lutarioriparius TaxID=422564 RepID=A0A811Q7U1_9POAL|nr:unnamed protein product [Miscanthus lutarioriparius]